MTDIKNTSEGDRMHGFLPPQVPHTGPREDYFIGSGTAGAAGSADGAWNFLIGPDYTSPNFIKSEIMLLVVDGEPVELRPEMHRARHTGIFYGTGSSGDVEWALIDYTNDLSPWVARAVAVYNRSANSAHEIAIQAVVEPSDAAAEIAAPGALIIKKDTTKWCFGNKETMNWADRHSLITFDADCDTRAADAEKYVLTTTGATVGPGGHIFTALYHYQYYAEDGRTAGEIAEEIKARAARADLEMSVGEWRAWYGSGDMHEAGITDEKARDIIEGSLFAVKMQQNRDGGIIAGIRKYANSYVRDCHGGARLLGATGHDAEVRKIIFNIEQKWRTAGFIPNWWSMGSDTFIGHSFNNDASEVTAYYMLMVRDCFRRTGDRDFMARVADSVKWAADVQIGFMAENGWKIDFNGDESEQYCCKADGQEYGGFPAIKGWKRNNWSFASAAAAVASIDFYIEYLRLEGRIEEAAEYADALSKIRAAIDEVFWDREAGMHRWVRSRGDNAASDSVVTNFSMLPLWIGARLDHDRQNDDARAVKRFIDPRTGFLPNVPGDVEGFCGHGPGLLLYTLKKLGDPAADSAYRTIVDSGIVSCWGTVSEFYGPGGVPNGHNYRAFESGPVAEALIRYFTGF